MDAWPRPGRPRCSRSAADVGLAARFDAAHRVVPRGVGRLPPGWLAGADALFDRLAAEVPWRAEERPMYDRVVDVPRLLAFYDEDDALPDPLLVRPATR